MLTRRVSLLQQCSCLKSIYSRKSTKAKVEHSELAFHAKSKLPIPKPKVPKKEPFVKGFFLGKFDNEILTYPEPQPDERYREFNEWLQPIEEYMRTVDVKKVYESTSFSNEMREKLTELGVHGGRISYDYDGVNLLDSEYLKLVETLSIVPKVGLNFLECNNFPVELLKKYGTVEQKYKYLKKIATGQYYPVICVNENECRVEVDKIYTVASLSLDEKTWSLNGQKTFVQQDNNSNLFIVYALGRVGSDKRRSSDTLSAFIVDKNTPGVGECIPIKSPWLGSANMFAVKFKDVVIPYENLIGEVGDGLKTLEEYYTTELVFSAGVSIGILKNFCNSLILHVINNSNYQRESVKQIISKTACSLYSMESMAYLTTGLADLYEGQDLVAEQVIVKNFCNRECITRLQEAFRILDTHLCMGNYPLDQVMRNQMFGMEGMADLKSYVALLGIQHTGNSLHEYIKKIRNPFYYPHFMMRKMFGLENTFQRRYFEQELHPSFKDHVVYLEQAFGRLEKCTQTLLSRHGLKIMTHEMDLHRLSEMASLIYALTSAFGRASRSYCIGLRNAEYELGVAAAFAYDAYNRIEFLGKEIEDGEFLNGDDYHKQLSQRLYDMKKYCWEHPLERNW